MNRSRHPLPSDTATRAALRRARLGQSIAAFGIVALLLAAVSGAGTGGKEPARAAEQPAVAERVPSAQGRPESPRSDFEDEFRLDERELLDYRSNVHG